jgi:pyruvate,water dikinase
MSTATDADAPPLTGEPVRPFSRLGRDDVAYAGGKGANLGELPVVGAPAYAAFCSDTGLRALLAELLDGLNVEDTAALQAASTAARELFDDTSMPEPLQREICLAGCAGWGWPV